VDEQDRVFLLPQFREHALQALLEITTVFRAGNQRTKIQRVDHRILQYVRHLAVDDLLGDALRDRGLADAGFADEQRIVLAPAAENLHGTLDLGSAADQRIDPALLRALV